MPKKRGLRSFLCTIQTALYQEVKTRLLVRFKVTTRTVRTILTAQKDP